MNIDIIESLAIKLPQFIVDGSGLVLENNIETDDDIEEGFLLENIRHSQINYIPASSYFPKPERKKELSKGHSGKDVYPRDEKRSINALKKADYQCEFDQSHETFIRKKDGHPYTEPHHIIPLCRYNDFLYDLDVEANIVSLCSNCHNLVHYGIEYQEMLRKLYEQRKELLVKAGLDISFAKLKEYYEITL